MAIGTFAQLKTAIETFRDRASDATVTANAADCIALFEARANRGLAYRQAIINTPLTATPSSRELALASDFVEARKLWLTTYGDFQELKPETPETMTYSAENGVPDSWCINGDAIDLNCPADSAHTFTFRYRQRFALSDSQTTNWLLTNHPDLYLGGALLWSGLLLMGDDVAVWEQIVQRAMDEVGWIESRSHAALATVSVDPALVGRGAFDINTGDY